MALFSKKETGFQGFRDHLLADQKEKDQESVQQFGGLDANRLELLACEIRPPETDLTLFEKHEADIASLTESLTELLSSRKGELTVDHERPGSSGKETLEPSGPQPLSFKGVFAPAHTSGGSAPALRPVPTSQHGLSNYNSSFFPSQSRIFFDRNAHHINYPVIPRWQDRAYLRRIQKESPELLPDDLPPWSVRDQVPTVPQPDWSEEGGFLKYDGFSLGLFVAYEKALEAKKVPIIVMPYSDQEMGKALVEKGLFSQEEVHDMIEIGWESWRDLEGREDEKYRREMREIEERGKKQSTSLRPLERFELK